LLKYQLSLKIIIYILEKVGKKSNLVEII